jgi:hypothetical protein
MYIPILTIIPVTPAKQLSTATIVELAFPDLPAKYFYHIRIKEVMRLNGIQRFYVRGLRAGAR